MLSYPVQDAAPSLRGKPPAELPHGLLTPPPQVRQALEEERAKHDPEVFAREEVSRLCRWTVGWYFDDLGHEVIYRETPQGPEVLAVGYDEMFAFRQTTPPEEQRKLKGYLGY
jgi:hypothetical protein